MSQAVEWGYAADVARSPDRAVSATILVRHHFSSNLKRMSALIKVGARVRVWGLRGFRGKVEGARETLITAVHPCGSG